MSSARRGSWQRFHRCAWGDECRDGHGAKEVSDHYRPSSRQIGETRLGEHAGTLLYSRPEATKSRGEVFEKAGSTDAIRVPAKAASPHGR